VSAHFQSTIHALLAACERRPDHPFLLFNGQHLSFAELANVASGWANRYHELAVAPGDRVALFLGNTPRFVAAYLGAHMAGAAVVLVNTAYRRTELLHILRDSGAKVAVTEPHLLAEIERVRGELDADLHVLNAQSLNEVAANYRLSAIGYRLSNHLALLAYTSGTTGRAKGAMLTHGNLMANSAAVAEAWRWTERDRLLLTLPLFHIHGLGVGLHGALVTGSTIDLRQGFDAINVLETLAQGETTMFFGVPTMYIRLIDAARHQLPTPDSQLKTPSVRLFVSGSAPLSPQTFDAFEALFGQRILERYGMTETVMNLTNPYDGARRPGTVGLPFPGQEARIVDVQGRAPLPDGATGEIQVRGPHVFAGYWQNPQATAETFDQDGWFSTGDLGIRSADGYYTISGRARELIISGGYNIYPREVEEVLETHPLVAEAAVLGLPDVEFGEQVAAVVVLKKAEGSGQRAAARAAMAADLIEWCRERLASYKKPRRVIFVESLPRNALGKVQKHLLREQILSLNEQT